MDLMRSLARPQMSYNRSSETEVLESVKQVLDLRLAKIDRSCMSYGRLVEIGQSCISYGRSSEIDRPYMSYSRSSKDEVNQN